MLKSSGSGQITEVKRQWLLSLDLVVAKKSSLDFMIQVAETLTIWEYTCPLPKSDRVTHITAEMMQLKLSY